jgi:hypothetical protein
LAPPGAIVIVTVVLGLPTMGWPSTSGDELLMLVEPLRMMDGDLPYADFSTAYGPAHLWFLEALYRATAATVVVERLAGLAIHVLLALGVYRLTRASGAALAALSGGIAGLLCAGLGAAPYAWITCATLLVWAQVCLTTAAGNRARVVAAGVLAGLTLAFRPDTALLVFLPAIVLLRGQHRSRDWAVGLLLGSVPIAVSLVLTPGGMLRDVLLGRAYRGAGQSQLPLPSDSATLLLLAGLLLSVVLVVAAAAVVRTRWHAAAALLAVLALAQGFQRVDAPHFLYASLLSVVFLPQALVPLTHVLPSPRRWAAALTLLAVGATTGPRVIQPLVQSATGNGPRTEVVIHDGRRQIDEPPRAAPLRQLLGLLDDLTTKDSRLFVFDSDLVRPSQTDLGVYYLMPNTRQTAHNLELNPGITNTAGARVARDIETADVVVLILATAESRAKALPNQRPGPKGPTAALERLFCHVETIDLYVVYRRCH